jgi:hypothetical protein
MEVSARAGLDLGVEVFEILPDEPAEPGPANASD